MATGVGQVHCTLKSTPESHPPFGLFGSATLAIGERAGVLTVPASAA